MFTSWTSEDPWTGTYFENLRSTTTLWKIIQDVLHLWMFMEGSRLFQKTNSHFQLFEMIIFHLEIINHLNGSCLVRIK